MKTDGVMYWSILRWRINWVRIKETVVNPDEVRKSVHDPAVLLFYKLYVETQ
jgi:hypothetical protein